MVTAVPQTTPVSCTAAVARQQARNLAVPQRQLVDATVPTTQQLVASRSRAELEIAPYFFFYDRVEIATRKLRN